MSAANYLQNKYTGIYRVMAEVDQVTNDFCRDIHGELNNPFDVYIKCEKGVKVFHYGGDQLIIYIPSVGRGHNIIKAIADKINISYDNCLLKSKNKNGESVQKMDWDKMYAIMESNGYIYNIEETDAEIMFRIRNKNLEEITDLIKPNTTGAKISCFSTKNLKIGKGDNVYQYTDEQNERYKKIISKVDNKLLVGRINNWFIENVMNRKEKKPYKELKADMKFRKLKPRDYIYEMGYEEDYLKYLEKEIKRYYEEN